MKADMTLHEFLDVHYGVDGDDVLRRRLVQGADLNDRRGPLSETPLHVAAQRYRTRAVEVLLDFGADIDAKTAGGKTAYAHAVRRGFNELAEVLTARGANTDLHDADRLAVAVVNGRLEEARTLLADHPAIARTGTPEEDRLLADAAGRHASEPVKLLLAAGADLTAQGLDGGTPLHQAAWFGQPGNALLLIEAGAPLDVFDPTHGSSPIGWAVHGSRYSGDTENRQDEYVELVRLLLAAGSSLHYPGEPQSDAYLRRLMNDASRQVAPLLGPAT